MEVIIVNVQLVPCYYSGQFQVNMYLEKPPFNFNNPLRQFGGKKMVSQTRILSGFSWVVSVELMFLISGPFRFVLRQRISTMPFICTPRR